jgi:hypothetical protein
MSSDLLVVVQGSPNTLLAAVTVHDCLFRHAASTIPCVLAAWQDPNEKEPHTPVGVPYEAKDIELMISPTGHWTMQLFASRAEHELVPQVGASVGIRVGVVGTYIA